MARPVCDRGDTTAVGATELAMEDLGENSTPLSPLSPVGLGAGLGPVRNKPHK